MTEPTHGPDDLGEGPHTNPMTSRSAPPQAGLAGALPAHGQSDAPTTTQPPDRAATNGASANGTNGHVTSVPVNGAIPVNGTPVHGTRVHRTAAVNARSHRL